MDLGCRFPSIYVRLMGPPIPSELQEAIERQRRIRIRLSIAAYAYEFDDQSIMSDAEFDELSNEVIPNIATGHEVMDKFFKEEFEPDTGMWIRKHPELERITDLYERYYKNVTPRG